MMEIVLKILVLLVASTAAQTADNGGANEELVSRLVSLTESTVTYPQWTYYDTARNTHCILVQLQMNMHFNYRTRDNRLVNGSFGFPNETVVHAIDGMCAPLLQNITLGWGTNNASTVTLQFMRLENTTDYWLSEMSINYNVSDDFANAAANQTLRFDFRGNGTFKVPDNYYYFCRSAQHLENSTSQFESGITQVELLLVRLQAFYEDNKTALPTDPHYSDFFVLCPNDMRDFRVFFIIFAALLVFLFLAIMVYHLVNYSRGRGYTSF